MEIDAGLLQLTQVPEDSPTSELPQQDPAAAPKDAQEFYHLEASSIVPAGDLQFELEPDDDASKILEFRHRSKTGTDDSAAEG